jgi:DNA (cytosine-5)-methyltransferase 1
MKAVSLFSGCGGFDLGLTRCGAEIIWANDVDHHAASAYRSIFPDTEFIHKDIRKIDHFPQAEILIGCYPCTGFSLAARRNWKDRTDRDLLDDSRNFLFLEFLRAIDQVKPKFVFVENVRGMLSASGGYFFKEQLEGLASRGFHKVEHRLLSGEEYGLAQSRKRVFMVGIHESVEDCNYTIPDPTHGKNGVRTIQTLRDVIGDMPEWPEGEFNAGKFHGHYLTRNRKRNWDDPSFTIVANQSHIPLYPGGEPMSYVKKDTWKLNGDLNRRLSWKECAAIQGLPLTMEVDGGLSAKYKVVGNAVPPLLAETVSRPIIEFAKQAGY